MKLERVIQYAQTLLRMSVAEGYIAVDANLIKDNCCC